MSTQRSLVRRSTAVVGILVAGAVVLLGATNSSAVEPLALVSTSVEVPLALRDYPFDQGRVLMIQSGFKISVIARIPGARFIMPLSTGEILVAQPGLGTIFLVRPQSDGTVTVSSLVEDLHNPQGMAFHSIEDRLYLYVGESNQVSRFLISPGAVSAGEKTVIVPNLQDRSSSELHGPYRHELKNLVIGPDNKLYVDVASSTNADPIDTTDWRHTGDPEAGKIWQLRLAAGFIKLTPKRIWRLITPSLPKLTQASYAHASFDRILGIIVP